MAELEDQLRRALQEANTPYQCYWRDRAFRAEARLATLATELADYLSHPSTDGRQPARTEKRAALTAQLEEIALGPDHS